MFDQQVIDPMSIRFAAPVSRIANRLPAEHVRAIRLIAANDDYPPGVREPHLHAALRHFAKHGLAAAQHAREQAIAAARVNDRQTFEWWLEICRALDRRMARGIKPAAESVS